MDYNFKVGDIVRVNNADIHGRLGAICDFSIQNDPFMAIVVVQFSNDGQIVNSFCKQKELTLVREANIVHSVIKWSDGSETTRVFDLNDHLERVRFATLASKAYLQNGTVVVYGVNQYCPTKVA